MTSSADDPVKLTHDQSLGRLGASDHGILCTLHADRGPDAVPVAFAFDQEGFVGIPIDTIKPKASMRLQRERNLAADPRATLLVEHWDRDDWSQLWWVRASLRFQPDVPGSRHASLSALLEARYPQYQGQPFVGVLIFEIQTITGWAST